MHWGRKLWKPQCFGTRRVLARKPAVDRKLAAARAPGPRRPRNARAAHVAPAPPPQIVGLAVAPTFAAHYACSGLLVFAFAAAVCRRLCSCLHFNRRPPPHRPVV